MQIDVQERITALTFGGMPPAAQLIPAEAQRDSESTYSKRTLLSMLRGLSRGDLRAAPSPESIIPCQTRHTTLIL